ncbi:hypothetical protein BST61_g10256 [Cercospora zeina]
MSGYLEVPMAERENAASHTRRARAGSISDVVDAVFREDAAKQKDKHDHSPTSGASRYGSGSKRGRGNSTSDQSRLSESVWANDKEKKNRDMVKKIFGHRLEPQGWK